MKPAPLDQILRRLREQQAEVRDRYGVEFVGVVGSVARGDQGPNSDIDVLMNVVGHTTYFRIAELEAKLEAELGRPVDLVDRRSLGSAFKASLERDLVPV